MSIDYYDKNSEKFIEDTFNLNMELLYEPFEKELKEGDTILDIGCGSGRDSKYFAEKGYDVYAHDGSVEMVGQTQRYIGDKAKLATFEEFDVKELYGRDIEFDGMWACASLLHIEEENMRMVISKYLKFLKTGGVFFMSFKMRNENHVKGGRIFTNYTRGKLENLLLGFEELTILEIVETMDVRDGREDEGWISAIVRKR
jgi:2-polyprenyl-3-methyl-5-hydroxy-6-metoxy-1,4-benzoquinol methylase